MTSSDGNSHYYIIWVRPEKGACVSAGAVADGTNAGLVSDCEALLEARDTLGGTATLSWSADWPIEWWEGVTVDETQGRVTRLDLPNTGLDGAIPAELGSLSMLTELNLHSNQLTGPIPDLTRLTELEELYLQNNKLTGPVPTWLNGMTNMRELWLWGNDLTGTIPDLSGMTSLEKLKLAANDLEGGVA